ncbi:MAG: hypothetical protein RL235_516 [Chlamydiota bacterium]|jgi:hypothetical protein
MSILCVEDSIKVEELKKRAKNQFKDRLVKAVVDVEKGVMAIGGAMKSRCCWKKDQVNQIYGALIFTLKKRGKNLSSTIR